MSTYQGKCKVYDNGSNKHRIESKHKSHDSFKVIVEDISRSGLN